MADFVRLLISGSEKAANIARMIRSEKELFQLLVQEKTDPNEGKNERFIHDFKTLADVLIQESLKHDISKVFPGMTDNIFGEESNKFTNSLGESITVSVQETPEATAELLAKVLDGNLRAAGMLAEEVHREVIMEENDTLSHDFLGSCDDIGVWIDPIDATNEYIRGSFDSDDESCGRIENQEIIWSRGLHCVTVLIGAFHMSTGQPIIGIINQPFWKFDSVSKKWQGRKFWGICTPTQHISSLIRYPLSRSPSSKKLIILSASEDESIRSKLSDQFDFVCSSGAGYKLLCVALGLADVYILSKPSTHYWDTCGPHAILKSLGGGIIDYKQILEAKKSSGAGKTENNNGDSGEYGVRNGVLRLSQFKELEYTITEDCKQSNFSNSTGFLAYREGRTANVAIQGLTQ